MSKLTNHVKSDKVKWVITAIAFVLAFVMLIGIAFQVFMPDGKKLTDWFEKQPAQEEELPEELPEDDGGAVIAQTSDNGIKLLAFVPDKTPGLTLNPTYTLTATVTPANATNKLVDYTAAWANPSSEWASGKNVVDYVKVTQDSSGSLTATVELLNAFSEQVIVSVTLRSDSSVNATCTVDYVGAYDIHLDMSNNTYQAFDECICYMVEDGLLYGTLEPELTNGVQVDFYMPDTVYYSLQDKGININDNVVHYDLPFDTSGYSCDIADINGIIEKFYADQVTGVEYQEFFDALSEAYLNGRTPDECNDEPIFTISMYFERAYNGSSYEGIWVYDNEPVYCADWSGFVVPGRNLSLNNTQLVFG